MSSSLVVGYRVEVEIFGKTESYDVDAITIDGSKEITWLRCTNKNLDTSPLPNVIKIIQPT